jgi:hypothetical protein
VAQILFENNGAWIVDVKQQMGHSSIQVTVNIYGHLMPGANVCFVDRLDAVPAEEVKTSPRQSSTPAQPGKAKLPPHFLQVIEKVWWRRVDSNHGPTDYETVALAT